MKKLEVLENEMSLNWKVTMIVSSQSKSNYYDWFQAIGQKNYRLEIMTSLYKVKI